MLEWTDLVDSDLGKLRDAFLISLIAKWQLVYVSKGSKPDQREQFRIKIGMCQDQA